MIYFVYLQENAAKLQEMKDDLRAECTKYGDVRKVVIHDVSIFTN